eukprot:TRINITY_DN622_c0_g1_i2.p2 TRINITY_DN622_c0_g1~~TRINITY_DN622_c0_g1_i2.p2  ORF type:complete len:375 (+),score=162.83 TRINITY_DN622_c0_g1_i2:87-1127(+)
MPPKRAAGASGESGEAQKKPIIRCDDISERYQVGQALCAGSFAKVFDAIDKKTGEPRAIKQTELSTVNTEKKKAWLAAELEITRRVNHPNIVQLYEVVECKNHIYMVFEKMDTDLFEWMRSLRKAGRWLSERDVAMYSQSLLSAVAYLHSHDIVHRDIKPENLLVGSQGAVIKLTDFGIAKVAANECTPFGSRSYMAPEIISGVMSGVDPSQTPMLIMTKEEVKFLDMWSCGTVIYFMLSASLPPIKGKSKEQLQGLAQDPRAWDEVLFPERKWKGISQPAKELVGGLLSFDSKRRLTAEKALQCAFITSQAGVSQEPIKMDIEMDELKAAIGDHHKELQAMLDAQ